MGSRMLYYMASNPWRENAIKENDYNNNIISHDDNQKKGRPCMIVFSRDLLIHSLIKSRNAFTLFHRVAHIKNMARTRDWTVRIKHDL